MTHKKPAALSSGPRSLRSLLVAAGSVLLSLAVYALLPDSMPELARRTAALFCAAAALWVSEALPLYATSLCVVGAEIVFLAEKGGFAGTGGISYKEFLAPFSSDIIILFMGGFVLSKALSRHGADAVITAKVLKPFAGSPLRLLYGILGVTAFASMWLSNTACTAIMLAIVMPLIRKMPASDPFRAALVLAVPFGANIGGIGTPVGTPPNAICIAELRAAGYPIGFLQWMTLSVPLMILIVVLAGAILYAFYRPASRALPELEFGGKRLSAKAWAVLSVLGLTIALWLTADWHGLNEGVVALGACAVLAATGLIAREDLVSIDWDILILMWGGLSLGAAMSRSGLTGWIEGLPLAQVSGFAADFFFILLAIGLSTLMSNTAAANIVVPLAIAVARVNPASAAFLAAIGASLDIALPISTPPNAMAFASGAVTARQMLRPSLVLTAFVILLLVLWSRFVLPVFFHP